MGSVMTCKLNPCCGDRRNCTPPERYDAPAPGPADAVSEAVVIDVLEAMLRHSCVSDTVDADKFPEDIEAERKARKLIEAAQRAKLS